MNQSQVRSLISGLISGYKRPARRGEHVPTDKRRGNAERVPDGYQLRSGLGWQTTRRQASSHAPRTSERGYMLGSLSDTQN